MKRNKRLTILFVLGILLIPSAARADGATPLMFAGVIYLLVGNLVIGICEGILISKVFKCRIWAAIGWMIAANYFSAWVGAFSLNYFDIEYLSIGILLITYCGSIILEYPFCYLTLRYKDAGRPKLPKQALLASIFAQTFSYIIILLVYYGVMWWEKANGVF